jgi:hypothetical protein
MVQLVRYISPFGTPAWMLREKAERHLAEDDARWLLYQKAGNLSAYNLRVGPPRIETGAK